MNETAVESASKALHLALKSVKHGTLRMFGDWFGRPFDNIHIARSARADGNDLVVTFNEDEELRVTDPAGWTFDEQTFRIRHASRVVWRWYSYGREKTPANLFTIEHWLEEAGGVQARSNEDWFTPTYAPSRDEAAVELL